MFHILGQIAGVVGEVGGGSESSPLSANSAYSEILRLVQLVAFAGVAYLIKEFKTGRKDSSETHGEILSEIDTVKELAKQAKELAQSNYEANRTLITTIQGEVKNELEAIHAEVKTTP